MLYSKVLGYGGWLSSVRGLKVESTTTCTVKEVCLWKRDTRQYIKEVSWSQLTWKYWVTLTVPKNISILNYIHGIYIFNTSFLWCSSTILPYKKNALRSTYSSNILYTKRNTWSSLHFPRRQIGSGLGKPRLSSTIYSSNRIILCLASGNYNAVNIVLFQIKNSIKLTQYLVSVLCDSL